jgi:cytochrome c553/catechol 2,3-dioxygenase-like lactoylglutathione lyase family enzyme
MKQPIGFVLLFPCLIVCAWPVVAAAQSESAGVAQYFNNCASCHESTDVTHQAPRIAVLKQMTPEHVLDVLTNGSMRSNAAALSDADKRLIAEWVGGRKIDNESVGAADKMTNLCSTHPTVRDSSASAWNGWDAERRNTRSQTAAAAGLTPAQISRLQLNWAFGFPGATALYSQTVYDGRLYVSSNAGYVYSLDAGSGCVHWAFRAQAAVRSSFTIGRLSRTNARLAVFFGDTRGTTYALDASTGAVIWKTLTDSHPLARVWVTPTLDVRRRALYVATGNAFSGALRCECRDGSQHGHRQGAVDDASVGARRLAQRLCSECSGTRRRKRTQWRTARRACCRERRRWTGQRMPIRELSASGYSRSRLGLRRSSSTCTNVGRTRNPHRTAEAYPGAAMLILLVRDIDSIFSRLKAAGVTVLTKGGAPMSVGPSKTARGVIVQDPDGHPIELAQLEPTPPTTAAAESNVIGIRLRITVRDSDKPRATIGKRSVSTRSLELSRKTKV